MRISLLILIFFIINSSFAQIQIGQNLEGDAIDDYFGISVSTSADGTRISIGATGNNGNGTVSGHVKVYENVNGSWVQIGSDFEGDPGDASGIVSISADGKRVAIGGPNHDQNVGRVRIYEDVTGDWVQIGQDIDGEAISDRSGSAVSISADGKKVAIGAPFNDGNGSFSGHTRIYEEANGNWVQIGQDIDGEEAGDQSGWSVSISADGKRVAIGAPNNDGNASSSVGHTRIYEELNGTWIQIGQDIDGEGVGDSSGWSVSISADGTRVAIGAHENDDNGSRSGQARIYEEIAGNWIQIGQDIDGEAPYDEFGWRVSISADGRRVASSARFNSENGYRSGHTRIYQEVSGNWIQIGQDINGEAATHGSGRSISISGDGNVITVGEPGINFVLDHAGQARIFKLNGTVGRIYFDYNQNCNGDTLEFGLGGIPVLINPGNYISETNYAGSWGADLPVGTYTLTLDTSRLWTTNCTFSQSFSVINQDSILIIPPIGFHAKYPCPAPDISIHMPFIRPCFSDQVIQVQACNTNQATGSMNNSMVLVTLDSLITPTSFELPYLDLGNNRYQFDLDTLHPGQCIDFWIKATVSCNAVLGQAVCVQAQILPVDSCVLDSIPNPFPPIITPCIGEWDESSLKVDGYCLNDTIYFEITNVGVGNMACYNPVTVYVDGVLHLIDSVMLDTQQVAIFSFPGNGESWHLEVSQHPNHPGNSNPKATVENCGGATGQTLINLFAQDDADPIVDFYCGEVTASYDPNDKIGYPIGLTSNHHIEANQQIQYRIRFQNTGTDTAFTVVIRDTLDTNLDIFTVRAGVSSHDYSFRMYGQRVLEWTFTDIMLPDSNVNEPLSHGFILFTVDQLPDLLDGTQITNSAGIYFDFNAPIITNVSQHEVHYEFSIPVNVEEISTAPKFTLYPNPNDGQFFIDLKKEYKKVELTVTDISGRVITVNQYTDVSGIPMKTNEGAGIYFIKVSTEDVSEVFKVMRY